MIKFSNMTLQEFINLNRDEIPEEVLEYFDELQEEIYDLKEDNIELNDNMDRLIEKGYWFLDKY